MKRLLPNLCAVAAPLLLTGCSLFRVTLSTGDDPLPAEVAHMRVVTRGFYDEAAGAIASAADSAAAVTDDTRYKVRAMRWKIRATRGALEAAMQRVPEMAVLDTWLFYRRMDSLLSRRPDSLLFGDGSLYVRRTAGRLHRKAKHLASTLLPADRYELMTRFVAEQPLLRRGDGTDPDAATLAWIDTLQGRGMAFDPGVGTMAEVMADMGDRVGGSSKQALDAAGWTRDMLLLEWEQDSLRSELRMRMDSVERHFERLVAVAEDLPGVTREVTEELNRAVDAMMASFDRSVDNAFAGVERQRLELQGYVTSEREELVRQADEAAGELLAQLLDALPGLLGEVLLYVVLALVVLLGLPFAAGFWLGGLRQRLKERKM